MKRFSRLVVLAVLTPLAASAAAAESVDGAALGASALGASALGGSHASMERQHEVAVDLDYSFLETPAEVRELVEDGKLERLSGDSTLVLADVSFPYARPEVRMFVEWLAAQYHASTGEPLVVTSLTRPLALQPANAHELSVHPAGMAVDFRVPARTRTRKWLEKALLDLERAGVLDVTREHTPPHYHVAVFPDAYRAFVERVSAPALLSPVVVVSRAQLEVTVAPASPAAAAMSPGTGGTPRSLAGMLLASFATGVLACFRSQLRSARVWA